ncbi:MAG: DUF2179 domain-containing protein [Phycisphaerales bacterium]
MVVWVRVVGQESGCDVPWEVILTVLVIIVARIADVTLGTIRTVAVVQGRRMTALVLGFFEVLIWIFVVAKVVTVALDSPVYALAYAFGFALGNYIGVTIEERIAAGHQVVKVFSRQGNTIATAMREAGYRATVFLGEGRDGTVYQVFVKTERRKVPKVCALARELDSNCFYLVETVRSFSVPIEATRPGRSLTWWPLVKKK